jgi:type VI secretion system protein ImpK
VETVGTNTSNLTDLATEISLFALGMHDRAGAAQFSSVHAGAIKLLDEFESRAKAQKFDPGDIADSKYALAAFIDEVVLNADWAGREDWAENPLQLQYFGTYLAGEGFFEKLETLRSQAKIRSDVLRLYYQCLLLGFKGKYGIGNPEILDALKKSVQSTLESEQPVDWGQLCPHWQPADKFQPQTDKLPRWFLFSSLGVVAVCAVLYVVLLFMAKAKGQSEQPTSAAICCPVSETRAGVTL